MWMVQYVTCARTNHV